METKQYLTNKIGYILNEDQSILPLTGSDGEKIEWQLIKGHAAIDGDKLHKTGGAIENEKISLKATINQSETVIFEDIILKDPLFAHLMTYFNHDEGIESGSNKEAGIRLAYSYDGLDWQPLNNGKGVVNATLGTTNWLRDPNLFRMLDGSFGIVATQGWNTPYIFYWNSQDMITFDERLLKLSRKGKVDHNPHHTLLGERAWAPKAYYDIDKDSFYILWSDPKKPRFYMKSDKICRPIYYSETKDFIHVSEPSVFFQTGFPIIDASIACEDGFYYLFAKDERGGKKNILMAISDTLSPGSFQLENCCVTDKEDCVEGPFAFKSLIHDKWYLYYDDFQDTHTYKYSITNTLALNTWEHQGINPNLPVSKLSYETRISHGGQIEITEKELQNIIMNYPNQKV